MILDYDFVAGDTAAVYGPRTLLDAAGNTIPLTGCTVNLNLYANAPSNQSLPVGATPSTRSATINPNGTVQYQFQAGDLVAGYLWIVLKIINSAGQTVSETNPQLFLVRPQL